MECNLEKSRCCEQDLSSTDDEKNADRLSQQVCVLRDSIEREKRRHEAAVSTLCHLKKANRVREENKLHDLMFHLDEIEDESPNMELNLSKEPFSCGKLDKSGICALTRELKATVTMMEQLEQKLRVMECKLEDEILLYRNGVEESNDSCKSVVKGRIDPELRCEQLSKNIEELEKKLRSEESKSAELSITLQNVLDRISSLQEVLEGEKDMVNTLTRANEDLKMELERINSAASGDRVSNMSPVCGIRGRTGKLL